VRKVEHAHHAENQSQPGAEHEEQQSVTETVEHGDDEKLHKRLSRPSLGLTALPKVGLHTLARRKIRGQRPTKKPDEPGVDRALTHA
jgi:hypothetical protein